MDILALAKKVYTVITEYERAIDYGSTAYLIDRVHVLEEEVAEFKRLTTNAATGSESRPISLIPAI